MNLLSREMQISDNQIIVQQIKHKHIDIGQLEYFTLSHPETLNGLESNFL